MRLSNTMRSLIELFVKTRLLLLFITYATYILFTAANYTNTPVDLLALSTRWNTSGVAALLDVAQYGYQKPADIVSFPLFPVLVHIISRPLGNWSLLLVGTVISNLAFLAALLVAGYWLSARWSEEIAYRVLLYYSLFPGAIFFFASYNIALALLLEIGAMLALQRHQWLLAGLLGCAAALTDLTGVLLVLPVGYLLWKRRKHVMRQPLLLLQMGSALLFIPAGLIAYLIYCGQTFGQPWVFFEKGLTVNWQSITILFLPVCIAIAYLGKLYPRLHICMLIVFATLQSFFAIAILMHTFTI